MDGWGLRHDALRSHERFPVCRDCSIHSPGKMILLYVYGVLFDG